MRADAMSYINVGFGQSNPLNQLSGNSPSARSSKAAVSSPRTDQAGAQAYNGLLSLALQLNDPVQDSRVQELRQAIEAGSYKTDLAGTGKAIVDAALNLD